MPNLPVNYTRIYKPGTWSKCSPGDPSGGIDFLGEYYKETGQYFRLLENHDISRGIFKLAAKEGLISQYTNFKDSKVKKKLENFVQSHMHKFLPLQFPGEPPIYWNLQEVLKHIQGYKKNILQLDFGQKGAKKASDKAIVEECKSGNSTMTVHGVVSAEPLRHFQSQQRIHASGVGIPFATALPFRVIWLHSVKHWEVRLIEFLAEQGDELLLPSLHDSAFHDLPVKTLAPGQIIIVPASYTSVDTKEAEDDYDQEVTSPSPPRRQCSGTEIRPKLVTPGLRRGLIAEEAEAEAGAAENSEGYGLQRQTHTAVEPDLIHQKSSEKRSGTSTVTETDSSPAKRLKSSEKRSGTSGTGSSPTKKLKSISGNSTTVCGSAAPKNLLELLVCGRAVALGHILDSDPSRMCHGKPIGEGNVYVEIKQVLVPGTVLPLPTPEESLIDNVSFVAWPLSDVGEAKSTRFRRSMLVMFVLSVKTMDEAYAKVSKFVAAENKKKRNTFTQTRGKSKDEILKMVADWAEDQVLVTEPLLSPQNIKWRGG